MNTLSLLHPGCTRSLDASIAQARARYAAERNDFHDYFFTGTIADIQRELRGEAPSAELCEGRVLFRVFDAQRERPHQLWALLLVQAFETTLVRRRRMLGLHEDPTLDALVMETFLGALEDLPYSLDELELQTHIMEVSRIELARRLGRRTIKPCVSVPPVSSVVCADEPSASDLDAASPTEVA